MGGLFWTLREMLALNVIECHQEIKYYGSVEFRDKECHTSLKEACVMSIRRMLFTWALRTEISTPVSKTGKVGSRPAAPAIHSIT